MAKATRIRVSVGYTKNAGNYESARVEETIELELDEGESSTAVIDKAREWLKEKCYQDAIAHVEYMKSKR